MDRRLIDERLDRGRVLLPLLLSIAVVLGSFFITEGRRAASRELNALARAQTDALILLTEAEQSALSAEGALRDYLYTHEPAYRTRFDSEAADAMSRLSQLGQRYEELVPGEVPLLHSLSVQFRERFTLLREAMRLHDSGRTDVALRTAGLRAGSLDDDPLRVSLNSFEARQRELIADKVAQVSEMTNSNIAMNAATTAFTLCVLLVAGLLASRDLRRRQMYAGELQRKVDESTHQLRDLGQHMARITEMEKHALARELHDELGGVLVALRMDLSQIRRRLPTTENADLDARWQRVDQALGAGIELKRRVIEELRPTLLDNMGLYSALRWQVEQTCGQAGIEPRLDLPQDDVLFPPEVAIAIFRTVQEAVSNVARHADASQVGLQVTFEQSLLSITLIDDGCGLPPDAESRSGAHGVKQMRFRIESLGGYFRISPRLPRGTEVAFSVPCESVDVTTPHGGHDQG